MSLKKYKPFTEKELETIKQYSGKKHKKDIAIILGISPQNFNGKLRESELVFEFVFQKKPPKRIPTRSPMQARMEKEIIFENEIPIPILTDSYIAQHTYYY